MKADINSLLDRKTLSLATIFFFIIGALWLLGSLQEPIFYHLVGRSYHPLVNIISSFGTIPLMALYMALLSFVPLRYLFFTTSLLFAGAFIGMGFLLLHPIIGLANIVASPERLLGWVFYVAVKSYGSFMVMMFWSFATTITHLDEAKRIFPLIAAVSQIGSISGAWVAQYASYFGIPYMVIAVGCIVAVVGVLLLWSATTFMSVREGQSEASWETIKKGFIYVVGDPYVRSVAIVSTAFLIITSLYDFQMNSLAHSQYITTESFTAFKSWYGVLVNSITLIIALLGTRTILQKWGVRVCLWLYPLLTLGAITISYFIPTLEVIMWTMIALKSFSYALHNPLKELLYVPKGQSVRLASKAWIDVVGYRGSYSFGSWLLGFIKEPFAWCIIMSYGISVSVIAMWLLSVHYLSKHFSEKTSS